MVEVTRILWVIFCLCKLRCCKSHKQKGNQQDIRIIFVGEIRNETTAMLILKFLTAILNAVKKLAFIIVFLLVALNFAGCGRQDKSKIIEQYKYNGDVSVLDVRYKKEIGDWLKEGVSCYGIVMVRDENKVPVRLKEVYAKVISIHAESIKMEILEDVYVNRAIECNKITLKKGESWDELDGELFKTREEAIKFIDTKYPGLRKLD